MPKKESNLHEDEVWVDGFEGHYAVSSSGNVISYKKGRVVLKGGKNTKGYCHVRLFLDGVGKTLKVHTLVVDHFLTNVRKGLTIDHIDNNKNNNSSSNLRIVTNQVNCEKALSKVFWLLHKDGSCLLIHNLSKWCRNNNKDLATFYKMFYKERKSAYGFIDGGCYAA